MGFLKNTQGSIISDYFKLLDDVAFITSGNMVDVALYDSYLSLKLILKKETVNLDYVQITDVSYGLKSEISQKDKSVIGRALLGGVLFGPIGAVVGGVSGVGKKSKKDTKKYLMIAYRNGDGNDKVLQFEDTRSYKGAKLANKLKELTGRTESKIDGNGNVNL